VDLSAIDGMIAGLDGIVEEALDEAAQHALKVAQSKTKGELASSLTIKRSKGSREITTDKPYAQFVEEGRGPIEANGKALHFVKNGQDVFVRHVGPATPHPFIEPAQEDLEEQAAAILARRLGNL
jgi:hypothetical protein